MYFSSDMMARLASSHIMERRGTFHHNWQRQPQKLYSLTRHESGFHMTLKLLYGAAFHAHCSRPGILWRSDTNGVCCSVTGFRYTDMLQNYVLQLMQRVALNGIVWIQDGAHPHIAKCVSRVLEQHFGDNIISYHSPFPCFPRSQDLTRKDFWFCKYLKSKV